MNGRMKQGPIKYCQNCGTKMERKRFSGRPEDMAIFLKRKYCDLTCTGEANRKENPGLSALRKRAIKHRKDKCEMCETTEDLQAHHLDENPANNVPENIMTLCGPCHTKWHWAHGKTIPKRHKT